MGDNMMDRWQSLSPYSEPHEGSLKNSGDCNQGNGDYVFNEEEASLLHTLLQRAALKFQGQEEFCDNACTQLRDAFKTMMITLQSKDPWARGHSERVTKLAVNTASRLGLSGEDIRTIQFGGYLHDIGKMGIRYSIITKPGKLSPEEFDAVKGHPVMGEIIAKDLGMSPGEISVVKSHHEHWDGNGYPEGTSGEDIPYLARILAVADSYDAMTSYRPYKDAMSPSQAESELRDKSGWQFDGDIVAAFINAGA